MIVGVVLNVLGAVISVFSLTCLTMTSIEDSTKAKMSLTAGIMFIIAGRVTNKKKIWVHLTENSFVSWWNKEKPSTGITNVNRLSVNSSFLYFDLRSSWLSWRCIYQQFLYEINKSLRFCISITFSQVCVALQEPPSMPIRLWPVSGCLSTSTMGKDTKDTEETCRAGWGWGWEWVEKCPRRI